MAGRYSVSQPACIYGSSFNPRPTLWPGATAGDHGGRLTATGFNPRPTLGRALLPAITARTDVSGSGFQSSPDPLAGRYAITFALVAVLACFNPRPTLWPGATARRCLMTRQNVSILARPSGRALHGELFDGD